MKPFLHTALASVIILTAASAQASNSDWTDGQPADSVLGQADFDSGAAGTSASELSLPGGISIDKASGKIFVSDLNNSRVLRYGSYEALSHGAAAEAVLGQPDFETVSSGLTRAKMNGPKGVFVDHAGRLWVADSGNKRVLRFDNASTIPSGSDADSVLGQPDFVTSVHADPPTSSSLNFPSDVVLSPEGNLFVSDVGDDRVLRYNSAAGKANGAPADSVFFQPDFTTSGAGLASDKVDYPKALELGPGAILWVADSNNNRVLRFDDRDFVGANPRASAVIGFDDFVSKNLIDQPGDNLAGGAGLAYDADRDVLYIASEFHNHILVLENGSTASGGLSVAAVLGQPDLATTSSGLSDAKLYLPGHIDLDKGGRLWVTDRVNNRAVRFSPTSARSEVQPDLSIGPKPNRLKGNDRYNRSGAGQVAREKVIGRKRVTFAVRLQNDGYATYPSVLRATRKNKFFKVKYRSSGGNLTGAITRGRLQTDALSENGNARMKVDVKPTRRGAEKRKTFKGRITANDPERFALDAVRYQVKTKG